MKLVFLDSIITTPRKENLAEPRKEMNTLQTPNSYFAKELKDELVIVVIRQFLFYETSLAWKIWYLVFIYRYMIS